MINTKDIIKQKERELLKFTKKSQSALDIVTSTISKLTSINEKIGATIVEIEDVKEKLQNTEENLNQTKIHNTKIISKFKALLED